MLLYSEQKRRFQQQYPDSPSDVIDDAMRRHWESLGDRDRHRYLQRARSAMAVERGRQLGRRTAHSQLSFRGLLHQGRLRPLRTTLKAYIITFLKGQRLGIQGVEQSSFYENLTKRLLGLLRTKFISNCRFALDPTRKFYDAPLNPL